MRFRAYDRAVLNQSTRARWKVDDRSKANSGRHDSASGAPSVPLDPDVPAETPPRTPQQQRIEAQRAQLLQAHGVLMCLYDVLLHAEGEDAIFCAQAAHVAANLINNSVEELDSVRLNAA